MNKVFIYVLVMLLAISIFFNLRNNIETVNVGMVPDTARFTIIDTVVYYVPIPVDSVVVRYTTAYLPVAKDGNEYEKNIPTNGNIDTENISDSVNVVIPITQKMYEDSTYKAWISGYHTALDSIYVFPRNEVITITNTPKKKRWSIGAHAGYGITPHGAVPYIGIGISCNLFSF